MDPNTTIIKEHPKYGANPLSELLFTWIVPLLWKGSRKGLDSKDQTKALPDDLSQKLGDLLESNWYKEIERKTAKGKKPSLAKVIIKTFWKSFILDGFLLFLYVMIKSTLPVILGLIILHFTPNNTVSTTHAYYLAGGMAGLSFLAVFCQHHAELRQRRVGMRIRIACCSLIYRKVLRLSKSSMNQISSGQLINLLSNDVNRYDVGFGSISYLWIIPLQIIYVSYLIYLRIGYAAAIGVTAIALQTIPIQGYLSKWASTLRLKTAETTDERVRLISEIISGIKVIKMFAWEVPFERIVSVIRNTELKYVRSACYLRGFNQNFTVLTERTTLYITLLACVFFTNGISTDTVFSMAQFFNVLQLTMAVHFPNSIFYGSEAIISTRRIENFLLLSEVVPHKAVAPKSNLINKQLLPGQISIGKYITGIEKYRNDRINLTIKPGQLCIVIGPVGSGKSFLLKAILGENVYEHDPMNVYGEISYSAQMPWLFNGTIRSNILFGRAYNKLIYQQVVYCTGLYHDLQILERGDQTVVGDRGATLSGGQKARINLARAVYRKVDIYLIDDPFSAVDSSVARQIFDHCIGPTGKLSGSTRVLVTHQLNYLKYADWIVVMKNGHIEQQGTYVDVVKNQNNVASFLHEIEEEEHESFAFKPPSPSAANCLFRSLSLLSRDKLPDPVKSENQESGLVAKSVYWRYVRAGVPVCCIFAIILLFIFVQVILTGTDYWAQFWSRQEFIQERFDSGESTKEPLLNRYYCIMVYTILVVTYTIMTQISCIIFVRSCINSSKNLHNAMFNKILRVGMNFFDVNPSGRILNRFSKDLGIIDENLPRLLMTATQISLVMAGILVMILIINPWLMLPMAGTILLFWGVLILYVRFAQDCKRIEGITRSPVFSHMASSVSGLTTIRSNKAESILIAEFDALQDNHTVWWYFTIAGNSWLGFSLDLIGVIFISCVTFSFVLMEGKQHIFSGSVGLAISQSMMLTGVIQFGLRQAIEVFRNMTSVERILEYVDLESEGNTIVEKDSNVIKDWPKTGKVEFKNVSLTYENNKNVLKNVSFVVAPGWKVGIVGRTGAGKSSIISALFRLVEVEGSVIIDGLDIRLVSIKDLRSKISVIPQDPVLFSATVRFNLDPFNKHDDAELWAAIEDVEMKKVITNLDSMMTDNGRNYSVGQKQLICLARAILRRNKVLVLDEATSNIDPQTDEIIQNAIRKQFINCTVITIAHRLNTVMDSDCILVIEDGTVKEYGPPEDLLEIPNGILSGMVKEARLSPKSLHSVRMKQRKRREPV